MIVSFRKRGLFALKYTVICVTSTPASSAKTKNGTPAKLQELAESGNYHLLTIAMTRHCHFSPLQSELYICIFNGVCSDSNARYDDELKVILRTNTNKQYQYINSKTVNFVF